MHQILAADHTRSDHQTKQIGTFDSPGVMMMQSLQQYYSSVVTSSLMLTATLMLSLCWCAAAPPGLHPPRPGLHRNSTNAPSWSEQKQESTPKWPPKCKKNHLKPADDLTGTAASWSYPRWWRMIFFLIAFLRWFPSLSFLCWFPFLLCWYPCANFLSLPPASIWSPVLWGTASNIISRWRGTWQHQRLYLWEDEKIAPLERLRRRWIPR